MRFVALLIAALVSFSASAATPYKLENIMLLQPEFVLKERVPSVNSLTGYIKSVQDTAKTTLSEEPSNPTGGFLVLAVRPGKESMVWLDFKPALPQETADRLRAAINAVPPFSAKKGTVVFALNVTLWGGSPVAGFPNPAEWSKAMEGHDEPMEIGELVDKLVWPKEAGT